MILSCSHRRSGRISPAFDLDGNGAVDFPDFILFAKQFGEGAPEESITITLPGDVKLAMVWIQPGRFLMGSPDSESGREDHEGPQHQVTITRGFYLGKYEVTQAQWESVMNTSPWVTGSVSQDRGNFPANRMRWPACRDIHPKTERSGRKGRLPIAHRGGVGVCVQGRYDEPLVVR